MFDAAKSRMQTWMEGRPIGVSILVILAMLEGIDRIYRGIDDISRCFVVLDELGGTFSGGLSGGLFYDLLITMIGMAGVRGITLICIGFVDFTIGEGLSTLRGWARMGAIIMVIFTIITSISNNIWLMSLGLPGDIIGIIIRIIIGGIVIGYLSIPTIKEVFE